MGILGGIATLVKAVMPTKEKLTNVVTVLSQSLNPFSSVKPVANVSNPTLKTVLETVAAHPYATAAFVATPVSIIKSPAVATVAKTAATSLIPKTIIGKVATTAAIPIAVGVISKKPVESAKALISAPSNLANFGGNTANLISNPSVDNLKTLFKENPVISTSVVAGAVAVAGLGTAGLVSNYLNTQAVKENTAARSPSSQLPFSVTEVKDDFGSQTVVGTNNQLAPSVPQTPQTNIVNDKVSVKRKRRSTKPLLPSIRQNVNVMVSNNNTRVTNKKYINREVLVQ